MIFGRLLGSEIMVVEGRFHLYEERGLESAMLMASFLEEMGVEDLVLTTAVGALAPHLRIGDFVVIRGHLVYPLGGRAPGIGRVLSQTGLVGGRDIYAPEIAAGLESACLNAGVRCRRGVLAFSEGPCYETAAEARLLRWAGADVVSMSAAADAVAAHCLGLRVGCLCCVTNRVGMWRGVRADHGDVLRASGRARSRVGAAVGKYLSSAAREA
jgi:purine-nucleoside phosphorylase